MLRHIPHRMLLLAALLLGGAALSAPAPAPSPGAVKATLELNQQFYYVGEPLQARITITNTGDAEAVNPVKGGLAPSFHVLDAEGHALKPDKSAQASEPQRPAKLAAKSGYFAIIDLTQPFAALKSRGQFTLQWSTEGLSAEDIVVHVIPRFDPAREYLARVETEQGSFVIDLQEKTSPIAVKSFVDMANAGFYDGLKFHEVRADQVVVGGDPSGTGGGQGPIRYPQELSGVPVVAGTVVLKPAGLAPPANASQFAISLKPEPRWTGQLTVLGQVIEGLDVVKRISNLASSERPSYRPLSDVHTVHVVISEKTSTPPAPTGGS